MRRAWPIQRRIAPYNVKIGRNMIPITQESAEVFYTPESLVVVGAAERAFLKERARENPRLRSRLCTHSTTANPLHEMIIVHHRDCYVRPHRHRSNTESLHVIEGSAQVVVFHDDGTVLRAFTVSISGADAFYYRMPPLQFHSILIASEWFIFHETTAGPFVRENTEFPDWAPDGSDEPEVRAFLRRTRNGIDRCANT